MSVSAATITPHVVDDAYIQSSDMSWHKGAWASLMHARMGHINNGEFEALRFSTRHVSSSMSRVEAIRAIDAEFQQLRTFGDAAPPAGKVTLKPRKRGARARARHGKAVDGHLCHVGPRYYGANLREPADYQSPPPLPTPSLIRERSNSVVYRTSRTWRGLLRGDEMSAILCVLVSLPLPNTTGHLWPYDGITTTPTWAHIVAIIGVTANVDMAVFYDIMLIGVALLSWVRPGWGNDGSIFATSLSVRQIGVRYGFEDDECNFADSLSDRPISASHTGHDVGTRDIRCSPSGRRSQTAAQRRPERNGMPGSYTTGLPQLRHFACHACHACCPRYDNVELSDICPVS